MQNTVKYIIAFGTMAIVLNSCHIYKHYERPDDIFVTDGYRTPEGESISEDTINLGDWSWQKLFKDNNLQALINRGLAQNVNLQTAILRVKESQALLLSAKLSYLPSLNLAPQGTIASFDHKTVTTYQLPVAASWEVDLFGKLLNSKREAQATLLQSKAYQQAVRSQLIANIANVYYTLLMLDQQMLISEETSKLWKETVRAMVAMKEAGMTTEAAVSQSQANSHQVEASLAELRRQVKETENSLSVLLAENPQSISRGLLDNQDFDVPLSIGVPMQLLSNRPDVKASEMTLAGAYYTTNQARSAFYPQLTISGTAGWTNAAGSAIINPGKLILSAVGQLAQPIFNRGKLIANLKVSKAEEEIAQMNFQQSILNAGKEVSDALYLYEAASIKLREHRAQVDNLKNTVDYTGALFQSGSSTYLELLTAQQYLLSAQLNEVSDKFQSIQAVINLYRALGGGRE